MMELCPCRVIGYVRGRYRLWISLRTAEKLMSEMDHLDPEAGPRMRFRIRGRHEESGAIVSILLRREELEGLVAECPWGLL